MNKQINHRQIGSYSLDIETVLAQTSGIYINRSLTMDEAINWCSKIIAPAIERGEVEILEVSEDRTVVRWNKPEPFQPAYEVFERMS